MYDNLKTYQSKAVIESGSTGLRTRAMRNTVAPDRVLVCLQFKAAPRVGHRRRNLADLLSPRDQAGRRERPLCTAKACNETTPEETTSHQLTWYPVILSEKWSWTSQRSDRPGSNLSMDAYARSSKHEGRLEINRRCNRECVQYAGKTIEYHASHRDQGTDMGAWHCACYLGYAQG